jgi:hypothetical protein
VVTTGIVPVERVRLAKVVRTEERVVSGRARKERIEAEVPGEEPTVLGGAVPVTSSAAQHSDPGRRSDARRAGGVAREPSRPTRDTPGK